MKGIRVTVQVSKDYIFQTGKRLDTKFYYGPLQVHPEGKYVVDVDKNIDITKITPSTRVALRNDSYVLHLILPSKVDPLVNLMKVEKVPDSTYDMIGGLDQQIKEIKEVH
jgi:26S proteasome regulatory subunit T6